MNKLTHYITLLIMFMSLNKQLKKNGSDFYGQSLCLAYGLRKVLKDGKVSNEELNELTGQIADTCASLVNLLEEFVIPEEEPEE
jgi:hypothetical protein